MTKNKKLKLKVVGKTQDNVIVVNGSRVFKLMESVGLPLDILLDNFEKENMIFDWIEFYETALEANWTMFKIFEKIEMAINDVYDKERVEQILKRLKYYVMEKDNGNLWREF